MGSSYGHYRKSGPCSNCGRDGGAFMGSSEWGHDFMCCSRACGRRLAHKLQHGMGGVHAKVAEPWGALWGWPADNRLAMRIRIKQLAARVKALEGAAHD